MNTPYYSMIIGLVFLLAGFTQGVAGFGCALVAVPLLTLFFDLKTVVPLSILNGLIITTYLCWQLRRSIEVRKIRPLLIGCVPGVYVGINLLIHADQRLMKVLLGIFIIAYALYALNRRPRRRNISSFWAYAAGFGTGAIGAAFSAGGPPTIIYTTLTGWSKDDIKATLSGFFMCTGLLIAVAQACAGLINREILHLFAVSAPFVTAGVVGGSYLYDRINQENYLRIILAALLVMGVMLIRSAV